MISIQRGKRTGSFFQWILLLSIYLFTAQNINAAQPVFTEVSSSSGISFQNETNVMSGGIAWIDFNNDNLQDLFVPNATGANRLYRNNGNGQFIEVGASAGIQLTTVNSQGAAVGDYDGDGYDDILVANAGVNTLFRNLGNGSFENATIAAGLGGETKLSYAASFGDVNNDGWLDIYVGHWDFQNQPVLHCPDNDLYLNDGNGGFSNVAAITGANNPGCSFTVPMTDYDQDGDLDLLLPNDNVAWGSQTRSLDSEMLQNQGVNSAGLPQFVAVGDEIGLGLPLTAMGVAIGDYNNDGHLDYYMTQLGAGPLSTNDGSNNFTSIFLGNNTGWGAAFFDADNDGFVDLYRANSGSGFSGNGEPNQFYYNNGDSTFSLTTSSAGLQSINAGLGLAYADYDNDGDMDVVVHGQNGDINLFRNDTAATNNWIKIKLLGKLPNHRGIGATIRLNSTDGVQNRQQMREIHAGSSHGSNHDTTALFGLGDHTQIQSITVHWPSGCQQTVNTSALNQVLTIDQAQCHTISGTVTTPDGTPVAGITFEINDNFGFTSSVITNANGQYSQEVTNGTYIVWPLSSDYVVAPTTGNVFTFVSGDDVIKDFTAAPVVYVISGTVTNTTTGNPIAGVTLTANNNIGAPPVSVISDASGNYALPDLPNGVYIVMAMKDGFSIGPSAGNVFETIDGSNVTKNYQGTFIGYSISGIINDSTTGNPIEGVTVTVHNNVGDPPVSVVTNSLGRYSAAQLPNGAYLMLASKTGYSISPVTGNVFQTIDGSSVVRDFSGTLQ